MSVVSTINNTENYGEITTNIDVYGGEGTAVFVANAIEIYCDKAE